MKTALTLLAALVPAFAFTAPPEPQFRAVTLDDQVQIGYGLAVADVDGDGRPDILLADKKQFVWYRNPGPADANAAPAAPHAGWQKHLLAENLTEKDNVCIAAQDLDGDGKCEIAVGAEWNPGDTEKSGAVFYLIPPADRTQPWTPVKFPSVEPTTHRMGWIRLGGQPANPAPSKAPTAAKTPAAQDLRTDPAAWGLVVVPLHGRGNKNGEGAPVKVLLYRPPAELLGKTATAETEPRAWPSETLPGALHMTHNFHPLIVAGPRATLGDSILLGGKEGFVTIRPQGKEWVADAPSFAGEAPQGVGEIRVGSLASGVQFVTTIEPMHGNTLAVYLPVKKEGGGLELARRVLTERLVDGHALACGNLLGGLAHLTASDQIVVGWRGKPGAPDSTTGVAIWAPLDAPGERWRETVIDPDGMACEDLKLADLDGDGKLDIVASGRATKNLKIYLNETVPGGK